jgi:aspartyl protease family protein
VGSFLALNRDSAALAGGAMFGRVIFLTAMVAALALFGSFALLNRLPGSEPAAVARAADNVVPAQPSPEPTKRESSGYRQALLEADQRGQYAAEVLIDGVPVEMLVDTGASEVCVSASTAQWLGLSPSGGRKYTVKTANGLATAYSTILKNVSFDGLYMNDVEALILSPESGQVNLLGESFLKRLASVEQRNGTLVLRQ